MESSPSFSSGSRHPLFKRRFKTFLFIKAGSDLSWTSSHLCSYRSRLCGKHVTWNLSSHFSLFITLISNQYMLLTSSPESLCSIVADPGSLLWPHCGWWTLIVDHDPGSWLWIVSLKLSLLLPSSLSYFPILYKYFKHWYTSPFILKTVFSLECCKYHYFVDVLCHRRHILHFCPSWERNPSHGILLEVFTFISLLTCFFFFFWGGGGFLLLLWVKRADNFAPC